MQIKLKQLPSHTLKRLSITLPPALAKDLQDYALFYAQSYGCDEQPTALIPSILEAFLASDSGFKKARASLAISNSMKPEKE